MENYGYKREYIHKCLINNEFNYATATFFLLSNNVFDAEWDCIIFNFVNKGIKKSFFLVFLF